MTTEPCQAVICSPWRMGMRIQCKHRAGHDGPHRFGAVGNWVEWTGQNDRLTEMERVAAQRRAERGARR